MAQMRTAALIPMAALILASACTFDRGELRWGDASTAGGDAAVAGQDVSTSSPDTVVHDVSAGGYDADAAPDVASSTPDLSPDLVVRADVLPGTPDLSPDLALRVDVLPSTPDLAPDLVVRADAVSNTPDLAPAVLDASGDLWVRGAYPVCSPNVGGSGNVNCGIKALVVGVGQVECYAVVPDASARPSVWPCYVTGDASRDPVLYVSTCAECAL